MMPLWSSYLVKVYAWKLLLAKEGAIGLPMRSRSLLGARRLDLALPIVGGPVALGQLHRHGAGLPLSLDSLHDPAGPGGLERVPVSSIEAVRPISAPSRADLLAGDLAARAPGIVAGSIFTFSLTLGDYIVPTDRRELALMIGQAVYTLQGTAGKFRSPPPSPSSRW